MSCRSRLWAMIILLTMKEMMMAVIEAAMVMGSMVDVCRLYQGASQILDLDRARTVSVVGRTRCRKV